MHIDIKKIEEASKRLEDIITKTPLQLCKRLSKKYNAQVYLKREDLQEVRSFKIRGAYNKMATLTAEEKKHGIVAASAGNHAQGVALSCSLLKAHGIIFMPAITPLQKIERVKHFGDRFVSIKLVGTTYDEASQAAKQYCKENKMTYVHPFDDPLTIAGQGTIGKEIFEEISNNVDYVIAAIGGGGLISGISSYLKEKSAPPAGGRRTTIKIYGAEPAGSPSMIEAIKEGKPVKIEKIDTFVDGAAVQMAGELTLKICKENLEEIFLLSEGKICTTMIELYQNEGIIAEPAGALSVAALDNIAEDIKGKTVVCILSGGNNDILRYPEIMERSLVYKGLKHYFLIEFAQKPGQLRKFLDKAIGPTDDIVRFEYMKKTNKEKGAALVGIELRNKNDLGPLISKMKEIGLNFRVIHSEDMLYQYLI